MTNDDLSHLFAGEPVELSSVSPERLSALDAALGCLIQALHARTARMVSVLDRPLRITTFRDRFGLTKRDRTASLRALAVRASSTTAPTKDELPLVKLGQFGDLRSSRGSLRTNENLLEISGIEGDYDGERVSVDEARAALLSANIAAVIYTSPSHSPERSRWRVLCACSRSLPPSQRKRLVERLNGVLGGVLGGESFTLSQAFYYGSVQSNPGHRVELVDGRPIDLADDLDDPAPSIAKEGDDRIEAGDLELLDGTSPLGQEADIDLVASALAAIPNQGAPDWIWYNTLQMAIWGATGGSEEGRRAAREWSEKNDCHDLTVFEERWDHYVTSPPTRIGAGTLFHLAKQHGWRDPRAKLPDLIVRPEALPETAAELAPLLAGRGMLFERHVPVRLDLDASPGGLTATRLTAPGVVREAHRVCTPCMIKETKEGTQRRRVTLPDRVAHLYLDMRGEWGLRPLAGIASSPLLGDDGTIRGGAGYDAPTALYRESVPEVAVPADPSRRDARRALKRLRRWMRTFSFADAELVRPPDGGPLVVDLNAPPGRDESAALAALLTAVARPSLDLAPGVLVRAPAVSGSGTGKGLLARFLCMVAFGRAPGAITAGHNREELEKRVVAALLDVGPAILLDNLNGYALRSDTLASVLTERPARTRVLGTSETAPLNSSALIIATGNGLTVSEDLARRFIDIELDARTEDPETREFKGDLLADARRERVAILADVLTIWRWGRRQRDDLPAGRPLGSYGRWARWCRDPLVALGCRDVVERVAEAKANDPYRRQIASVLLEWWRRHRDRPVKVADLAWEIQNVLDPQQRGRQFLASKVAALAGAQIAGFTLTRSRSDTRWGVTTYALQAADPAAADTAAVEDGALGISEEDANAMLENLEGDGGL